NPDTSGPHWYCDAVVADFRSEVIFLCEVSYSATLEALTKRLKEWQDQRQGIVLALKRDSSLPKNWQVRVWLFVPKHLEALLRQRLTQTGNGQSLKFDWDITPLEEIQPWLYSSWD